ncbi:molybdate transport system regulatory protein [Halorubrum aquaticum]|uniref:Molybdate transport system regulatory protein n=1 Tax=Halorubrum aquaticum TaxID=387340 RepID=A0A1I3C550_9EURY|nr:LysR family transcriptional regulator [Halorubrum aquaticum]SFH69667.1 molybdate transport system regulatory protein [Halorubrum aquaticum]
MDEATGRGRATLVEGDVEFDGRDAALLRTIARTGSVARASADLGRSRARALSRIDALEAAFGDLVERHRGGSGGGGSRLTDRGSRILGRYDRLSAALEATAGVPETVLAGTVEAVDGELAAVETALGAVWGLHEGLAVGDRVQVRIGADAVTVRAAGDDGEPTATSERNRRRGRVEGVDRGETVHAVRIRVENVDRDETVHTVRALVTDGSAERLGIRSGTDVWISWKATATRLVGGVERGE